MSSSRQSGAVAAQVACAADENPLDMSRIALDRVVDGLLGPQGRQRSRVRQSLFVLGLYLVCAIVQHAEVLLGLIELQASNRLTAFNLGGSIAFVAVFRSGLNQRYARDPSLTLPQCAFAIVALSISYAITGAARGAVMGLVTMILVFSIFTLSAREVVRLSLFAFAVLAGVMLWKANTDPQRYPPAVEAIHFVLAGVVILAIAMLSVRMTTLRARLNQQKADLEQALEKIRLLATKDDLTGLVNRRQMGELMAAEKLRLARSGQAMSLVLLDIDWFKRINDTLGHKAGDAVLQAFARVANATLRGTDALARWGGEEFLLMLPATPAAVACQCVERLRSEWAATSLDAVQPGLKVSFSAGVSVCGPGDAVDSVIERADQAMYRAKEAGRNCTVVG